MCDQQNKGIGEMLREAGVSRNTFYTLARNDSVIPKSLVLVADYLDVPVSALLEETETPIDRIKSVIAASDRIARQHKDVDRDNVRHTLLLLNEEPLERLRRALRRGRSFNFR